MEKHIIIDEEAIYNKIYGLLEDSYTLNYVSYDEWISAEVLNDILQNGLYDQLSELFDDQTEYYARKELEDLLNSLEELDADQKSLFRTSVEYFDLLLEIKSRNDCEAEKEIFVKTVIRGRVTIHSNYDTWIPLYDSRALKAKDNALEGLMSVLSLNPKKVKEAAKRLGVPCEGPFPDLKSRNGKEVINYDDLIKCLANCPNYALWTFFGRLDMTALWESFDPKDHHLKPDTLVIPKGTLCTMYNDWFGGGSLCFARTLRDLPMKEIIQKSKTQYDLPVLYVDERFSTSGRYCSSEVYGGTLSTEEILTAPKTETVKQK